MNWRENGLKVWAGFLRPLTMLRALHTQPEAWRRFVRVTTMQLIITVVVGVVVMAIGDTPALVAKNEKRAKATQRRQQRKAITAIANLRDGGLLGALEAIDGDEVEQKTKRALEKTFSDAGVSAETAKWLAFAKAIQEIRREADDDDDDDGLDDEELERRTREAMADGGVSGDPARWLKIANAMKHHDPEDAGAVDEDEDVDEQSYALDDDEAEEVAEEEVRQAGIFARVSAWVAFIISSLFVGQWVTLAFTREFQGPTGRALSRLANIEPEDPDVPPRFHIDFKWMKKKLQQRVRGFAVLVPGFFALIPLWVVTTALGIADYVMPLPTFAWAAYWWVSFTTARSARAWKDEKAAIPPLPVRWWVEHTQKTPGFRWFFPRLVAKLGLRATRRDAAPAVAMERAPFELIGLSLARLITSPPLIRLVFRTAIDTAVAETLEKHPPRAEPQPIPPGAESTKDADT